jgi:nicotinic acid mononucleotide adenylyltransferase
MRAPRPRSIHAQRPAAPSARGGRERGTPARDGPPGHLDPGAQLFLILGWDAARLFGTWHQPDKVRGLATIVVVARPGSGSPRPEDVEAAGLGGDRVILCLDRTPDVSASTIRKDIKGGRSIVGKVAPAVERYIATHHLYAE